jgi:hypothetical protein
VTSQYQALTDQQDDDFDAGFTNLDLDDDQTPDLEEGREEDEPGYTEEDVEEEGGGGSGGSQDKDEGEGSSKPLSTYELIISRHSFD